MSILIDEQLHGYRSGHQLLASSTRLSRDDQALIDRLSDLSGPLNPGQVFEPYLTTYPVPSGTFYVVARTWQDRAAARAGCVLTRSLLVPMDGWLSTIPMSGLLTLLVPFEKGQTQVSPASAPSSGFPLPEIKEPWTLELVEALFLEKRQPIVVFDATDAEVAVVRVLAALWPAMRRQFSTCTLALAPRSIGSQPFDLLCSIKASRIRFADWSGRKIDATATRETRHHWSIQVAQQVFLAEEPNLSALDVLGVFTTAAGVDEGALRLLLLWNELVEKVKESPTAALGLLDVLNSQSQLREASSILPILVQAIALSERVSPSAFEHFRFLITLLGKFSNSRAPLALLRAIKGSAEDVGAKHGADVLEFIASADKLGRVIPRSLCGGLAHALAGGTVKLRESGFSRLRAETRLRMVSSDRAFAKEVAESITADASEDWIRVLSTTLEYPDTSLRQRARAKVVSQLRRADQVPLLWSLLKGSNSDDVQAVVALLWKGCHLEVSAYDETILKAAASARARPALRDAVSDLPEVEATGRLLIKTLRPDAADLKWILTSQLERRRGIWLLENLLEGADDFSLEQVFRDSSLGSSVFSALLRGSLPAATQAARVLLAKGISGVEEGKVALRVLDQISDESIGHSLARLLLRGLFSGAQTYSPEETVDALSSLSSKVEMMEFISEAVGSGLAVSRVNQNIQLLDASVSPLRTGLLACIDRLSERIVELRRAHFEEAATRAWAHMISDAGETDPGVQLRAAEIVLPFALRMKREPMSPLIIVTFPIVHSELERGAESPTLLSVFFFPTWDRCDTARRELVDAFVDSDSRLPPADLLLAAKAAGVLSEVAGIISSRRNADRYWRAVRKDLERLPAGLRGELGAVAGAD